MKKQYKKVNSSYHILEQEGLDAIHETTLKLMEEFGVRVFGKAAHAIYKNGGCAVDEETSMIKFPREIVCNAIDSCPEEFIAYGRDPRHDKKIGGSNVTYTNFGTGVELIDPYSGTRKSTTIEDCGNIARFIDAVDEIDTFTVAVAAQDAPSQIKDLFEAEMTFHNTTKHFIHDADNGKNARRIIEMAVAIVGGADQLKERPIISLCICPNSPLEIHEWAADVIIEASKAGVPMNILSMGLAGGTTPVTLAGTLVTTNAEILAGIVLSQLVNNGSPVIYGSSTTIMDMKRATSPVGAPEHAMFSAAVGQIGHYYGIPTYVGGT